jgi:hypothetical protein
MGTKKGTSKNIKDHSVKKNDIVVRWNNGKIETSVEESIQVNSKRIGIWHALDILGESPPTTKNISSSYSLQWEETDATFINILPPRIELETILEPAIPPPRMWNIAPPTYVKVKMINPAPLYQMDLELPLEMRRTTAPPTRSVWFCDKAEMINRAPLYQMDLESPLKMR